MAESKISFGHGSERLLTSCVMQMPVQYGVQAL